ncbi:hypothetical protein HN51_039276 [Arachis hypogaea]
MANPTQPNVGYTTSNPDRQSPTPDKSPIPPPPPFASPPRFPPPILQLQQDQASSPSVKPPNSSSPANGVKSGSLVPHMSTPPGPPVFTSPVRPAAVPFRTSPASPRPLAFSSGSSLPTSSPPRFSNGSVELQHQVSDSIEDHVQTGNKGPGFVPVSDSGMSAPVVLVIDECLDEPHLQHLQSSLHAFVDSLPPTTRLGIVLYGRTVSIYDFSEESIASADVLPGDQSPTQ